jgi:hypothetical protein
MGIGVPWSAISLPLCRSLPDGPRHESGCSCVKRNDRYSDEEGLAQRYRCSASGAQPPEQQCAEHYIDYGRGGEAGDVSTQCGCLQNVLAAVEDAGSDHELEGELTVSVVAPHSKAAFSMTASTPGDIHEAQTDSTARPGCQARRLPVMRMT